MKSALAMGTTFDLDRLRQNWDRAATPPRETLPARLQGVATPRDPVPEAEQLLARISTLARDRFSAQRASLDPFLNEATALLQEMKELSATQGDAGPVRKKFLATLDDLQDLFEVYAGIGLR